MVISKNIFSIYFSAININVHNYYPAFLLFYSVYSFPNDKDTHGINTVRMALVWMDEYIELLYMNRPDLKVI